MQYESEDEVSSEEEEIIAPLHSIRLLVCSWNLGGKSCEREVLDEWIPPDGEGFDVIAIGTQENKTAMYEMMGATHPFDRKVADHLGKQFKLVGFHTMRDYTGSFGIRLQVFVRKEHGKRITAVEKCSQATGLGHVMGNKGGVMVKIELDGTSICFVTCHLAAKDGAEHQERREQDAGAILCGCRLGNKVLDAAHLSQTLSHTLSHTLLSYTPLMHSSHALLSCTPLLHSSHALLSYTPLMHSSPTLLSCTPLIHYSHTLLPYTSLIHSSHTLLTYTPLMHSSHALLSCTPPTHSFHALLSYIASLYAPPLIHSLLLLNHTHTHQSLSLLLNHIHSSHTLPLYTLPLSYIASLYATPLIYSLLLIGGGRRR
jgi:hypothetical protein